MPSVIERLARIGVRAKRSTALAAALGLGLAGAASQPVMAQEIVAAGAPELLLELNALQPSEKGCQRDVSRHQFTRQRPQAGNV